MIKWTTVEYGYENNYNASNLQMVNFALRSKTTFLLNCWTEYYYLSM